MQSPNKWSPCSTDDMEDNVMENAEKYGQYCLAVNDGSSTPPPNYGCLFPQWANDEYCNDENNTPECDFDGGACCPGSISSGLNPSMEWDLFCSVCQLLNSIQIFGLNIFSFRNVNAKA